MANIEEKVESLISKTIEDLGYELYDVIYEKEAKDYYLRVFIDTPNGISLDDCEKVNNAITDMLDEVDYIKEQYFLEVSSPGVERLLRKEKHLEDNIGNEIICNLFHPININDKETPENDEKADKAKNKKTKNVSLKQVEGILESFNKNEIVLQLEKTVVKIERKNIATMKLKYHWD